MNAYRGMPYKARVLILEDDPVQGEILMQLLQSQGYNVDCFGTGKEAVEAIERRFYHLAFLDIYLPDMSGLDFLSHMRDLPQYKDVPILMMTGDVTENVSVLAYVRHADEVLTKPLPFEVFSIKAKLWLHRYRERVRLNEKNELLETQAKSMAQYFSDDVVRKIVESGEAIAPETLPATVMFFDIRNFTAICENITPAQVAELLNMIFTDLTDLIFSHHGSVNKFIGDAIFATFGVPMSQGDDALNAVKCAFAIKETVDLINGMRPDYLREDLRFGIGIATGNVFAGPVGSFRRLEYTVLGDVVNVASRLESLNKAAGTSILIDGETHAALAGNVDCRALRLRGKIRGKENEVLIFEPLALKSQPEYA